eukprot:6492691-Amphidinium_carterae.2
MMPFTDSASYTLTPHWVITAASIAASATAAIASACRHRLLCRRRRRSRCRRRASVALRTFPLHPLPLELCNSPRHAHLFLRRRTDLLER